MKYSPERVKLFITKLYYKKQIKFKYIYPVLDKEMVTLYLYLSWLNVTM